MQVRFVRRMVSHPLEQEGLTSRGGCTEPFNSFLLIMGVMIKWWGQEVR